MAELKRDFDFKTAPIEEVSEYANVLLKLAIDVKNELEKVWDYRSLEFDGRPRDKFTVGVENAHKKLVEGLRGLAQAMGE